jgi:hypothetical protein
LATTIDACHLPLLEVPAHLDALAHTPTIGSSIRHVASCSCPQAAADVSRLCHVHATAVDLEELRGGNIEEEGSS